MKLLSFSCRISLSVLCTSLFLLCISSSLTAQVSSDDCNDATNINCGQIFFGTTVGATQSDFPSPTCASGSQKDQFYAFSALPGYSYTVTVVGEDYDGVLLAYSGTCESPTQIACSDVGFNDDIPEVIAFSVLFEQDILIRTYDYNENGGEYFLTLTCEGIGNDLCENAVELGMGASSLWNSAVTGSTSAATSTGAPDPSCANGSMNDVFYKIEAFPGLEYTISVKGSNYDAVLAAYTGNCGGALTEIACADNGFADNLEESISFSVDDVQFVLIQTYDFFLSGGEFKLTYSSAPLNSTCSTAMPIACGESLYGKTINSTPSGVDAASCYIFPEEIGDVFYTFNAEPGVIYEVASTPAPIWGHHTAVYTGSCDGTLTEISCGNNNLNYSSPVTLEFSVETAQPILIQTFSADYGQFNISLDCRPDNNTCVDAIPIACGSPVNGTTVGAAESGIPYPSCGSGTAADVFYALEALPNITYTATINGENYDAVIAAYIGECDGTLTELVCADEGIGSNTQETIEFSVESAQTVLIRTYDWFQNQGGFTLEVSCENENQSCADAIPIELFGQSECPDNAVIYSNEGSSTSVETCDDDFSPHTVFFSFNSGSNHAVNFNFNDITITDWIVQLVESCNGDIQYCDIGINSANVAVNPNTEYILTVSTNLFAGSPGTFALCATGLSGFCVEIGDFIGESCDDGDPDTFNDVIQENCTCSGTTEISALINGSISWNANCGSQNAAVSIYDSSTGAHIADYPTNINSSGQFSVNFNQAGTFDISLKVPGYLSVSLIDRSIIAGSNTLVFGTPLPGDLNNDNQINIADISFLTTAFGSAIGDPDFNPLADFNCDGAINILDVSAMTSNYGLAGSKPANS